MAETAISGSPHRVTIGPVTKQSSTKKIVFPLSMNLTGESLGSLPDWVSTGYEAVAQNFTEVDPEVQQVADIMLCFTNDKPKSGLFKNPDAKAPTSELRGFRITRTGDPDEPEVELQFKAFCAFSRELWAWLGEMCGEEVFMNFPTALAKSTPRPVPSMDLPLETADAGAQPAQGASGGEKAAPSTTKAPAAPPAGKSGPKDLAADHAKAN
jgi:hypothetical protein